MKLKEIAPCLKKTPGGWWSPATALESVSYPAEGNALCFAVEDASFWFAHRNDCILEAMKVFPSTDPFLDVGGGNGYVARAVQEAGFDVVLVEPGIDGVRNAMQRGIRHVVHSTSDAADIRPESIGGIGLFDVVEHIQEDIAFLRNMHNLLAPGGRVYITVPSYQWLWSHEDSAAGHARRYTLRTLREALEVAGFTIDYETYFFGFLPPLILLSRAIPYRLGMAQKINSEEAVRSDHELKSPLANRILHGLNQRELKRIANKRTIRMGGSCLTVARKHDANAKSRA
jgi:SAM-dependent methyltransferase